MADISVGDVGIVLSFGSTTINLEGATCTLTIIDSKGERQSVPLIVASTSTVQNGITYPAYYWCYRSTEDTDFTVPGTSKLQPVLELSGGVIKALDVMYIKVEDKL